MSSCEQWSVCEIPSHCHLSLGLSCLLPAAISGSRYPIGSSLTATDTHSSFCLSCASSSSACLSYYSPLYCKVSSSTPWAYSETRQLLWRNCTVTSSQLVFSLPPSVIRSACPSLLSNLPKCQLYFGSLLYETYSSSVVSSTSLPHPGHPFFNPDAAYSQQLYS